MKIEAHITVEEATEVIVEVFGPQWRESLSIEMMEQKPRDATRRLGEIPSPDVVAVISVFGQSVAAGVVANAIYENGKTLFKRLRQRYGAEAVKEIEPPKPPTA
jgi:hypothetical protein